VEGAPRLESRRAPEVAARRRAGGGPQLAPERPCYRLAKRLLDGSLAAFGLSVAAPLMTWIAIRIKLQDGGPVLFKQTRIGEGGRPFEFYKFRSMALDAEQRLDELRDESGSPIRFKLKLDPRTTPYGCWLRMTSLDELPQLWNVLWGDMSLVGPRPPIPEEVAKYTDLARRRLSVPQGLTCFWQVRGRSLLSFETQVALDLEYVEQRGLRTDLGVLLRTPLAVLSRRGAW
jgi:lipopolysaccharide/colanic/teichoic acid biosynthesis glycosyltransferase